MLTVREQVSLSIHYDPMFHKHAKLLAVQGTTDVQIACLVLPDKVTCIIARV